MRLNIGIRRRLAPLMDNGRRRIELLHGLLFSLSGQSLWILFTAMAVNVEAQQRYSTSLLNWVREMIHLRRRRPVFGRGAISLIKPENRKIFSFTRSYLDETVLCVFNLAQSAQPVELDLKNYEGCVPIEMMGETGFPVVESSPNQLALAPRGFYWVLLLEIIEPIAVIARVPCELSRSRRVSRFPRQYSF